jgi:hypothetical protein
MMKLGKSDAAIIFNRDGISLVLPNGKDNDNVPHASMEALALYHMLAENIGGLKDKMAAHAIELVKEAKEA